MRVILYPNPGDARGLNYGISDLLVFDGRSRASLRSRHLCIHAHHRGAGVAQEVAPSARGERAFGNGRRPPEGTMLPWALMPPSPNGRHRAWRKRFRRWWPGDSENVVSCGGPAPPFESASPRKGVALRLGSRRLPLTDLRMERRKDFLFIFRVFLCAFASLRQVIIINQAFPIYNISIRGVRCRWTPAAECATFTPYTGTRRLGLESTRPQFRRTGMCKCRDRAGSL